MGWRDIFLIFSRICRWRDRRFGLWQPATRPLQDFKHYKLRCLRAGGMQRRVRTEVQLSELVVGSQNLHHVPLISWTFLWLMQCILDHHTFPSARCKTASSSWIAPAKNSLPATNTKALVSKRLSEVLDRKWMYITASCTTQSVNPACILYGSVIY